jgi:hypothetical protein
VDAASGESLTGKFCMIDMFSMRWDNNSSADGKNKKKKIDLSKVSVFSGFPHWTAMCLPSACKEQEMQSALADLMLPYGMKVDGDFSCDTADEISWINRIKNMTMHQVIAAVLVVSFLAFVSACTAHDVYNKYIFGNISAFDPIIPQSDALKSFSMLESSNKLLYSKPMSYEVMIFEMMKVGIVLSVSWTHNSFRANSDFGVLSKHTGNNGPHHHVCRVPALLCNHVIPFVSTCLWNMRQFPVMCDVTYNGCS